MNKIHRLLVFYEAMGFKTYKKTELDEEENSYPLLYMKLDKIL